MRRRTGKDTCVNVARRLAHLLRVKQKSPERASLRRRDCGRHPGQRYPSARLPCARLVSRSTWFWRHWCDREATVWRSARPPVPGCHGDARRCWLPPRSWPRRCSARAPSGWRAAGQRSVRTCSIPDRPCTAADRARLPSLRGKGAGQVSSKHATSSGRVHANFCLYYA